MSEIATEGAITSDAQAADALAAASARDAAASEPAIPSSAAPTSPTPPATPEADAGTTGTPDSFTNIDPQSLPPELKQIYSSMQADYTRTKQEFKPVKDFASQLGDGGLERAQQALEFVSALESDPNFVVAVHQQLSSALEAAGLSPAQASEAASQEIQGSLDEQQPGVGYGDEFESPLAQEVAELRAWRQQQESAQAEQAFAYQLQRGERSIMQANPDYTEQDMEAIYEMAFAHGGDIFTAQKSYEALKQRFAESYMSQKAAVPAGVSSPGVSGHSTIPSGPILDPEEAHKAAKVALNNILANE